MLQPSLHFSRRRKGTALASIQIMTDSFPPLKDGRNNLLLLDFSSHNFFQNIQFFFHSFLSAYKIPIFFFRNGDSDHEYIVLQIIKRIQAVEIARTIL